MLLKLDNEQSGQIIGGQNDYSLGDCGSAIVGAAVTVETAKSGAFIAAGVGAYGTYQEAVQCKAYLDGNYAGNVRDSQGNTYDSNRYVDYQNQTAAILDEYNTRVFNNPALYDTGRRYFPDY